MGDLIGFLPADNVTAAYSRVAGETVAGSPYLISATLSPSGVLDNYDITYNTANFAITPLPATVTLSNLNHLYDRTQKSAIAITDPPGLPVDITYNGSLTLPTNAGSYAVVATVNHTDYAGITTDTLVIAKAIVDPGITVNNKIYDGVTGVTIATRDLAGVIGADVVNLSGGTATVFDKKIGNGKPVTAIGLGLSGADAGNYKLSSTSAITTADISPRTLTVTATGVNKIYDGTTAASVTLSDDRVGSDDLTTDYATASFLDPNVGSGKPVNVGGISITGGTDVDNYILGNITAATTANIAIADQTINVTIHAPATSSEGSNFNVAALATSGLPVDITTSGVCTGYGSGTANIEMTSGIGVCNIFYNQEGNTNYSVAATIKEDIKATQKPSITSANKTTFDIGFMGSFTVTTTGNPATPMTISASGALPTGVTFFDNNDGTATLSGIPMTAGTYSITITADNGVLPKAEQSFTLTIRNGPVIGMNGIKSVPDTGTGGMHENEVILDTLGITQITVEFSQDVNNPEFDTDIKDVTNPANYVLVLGSSAGTFQTVSCSEGVVAPDLSIAVDSVTYDNGDGLGPFVATLNINGGFPLNVIGYYRLYVCGTTSIVDATNVSLELAGDGINSGTDFLRSFRIQSRVADSGNKNSKVTQAFDTSNLLIPVTGFAPNQVTPLPIQPADKTYKSLGKLQIEIPTLGINFPIVGAAITKNGWDLTWLQNSVAYLEGSAYPTLEGNTVLTAHVKDANNNLGPFSDIKGMQLGQKIYIHVNRQVYVYQVRENEKILPSNISAAFKHEEYSWVTLVTCEDYNAKTGLYKYRRMVRAVLISVIPEN
jgi:LPXTG-site transpeptidase (sortase) family protein